MAALSIKRRKSAHPKKWTERLRALGRWGMQTSKSGSPAHEKVHNITPLGGSTGTTSWNWLLEAPMSRGSLRGAQYAAAGALCRAVDGNQLLAFGISCQSSPGTLLELFWPTCFPPHLLVTFCMFWLSFVTGLLHSVLASIRKAFLQVEPFQFNGPRHWRGGGTSQSNKYCPYLHTKGGNLTFQLHTKRCNLFFSSSKEPLETENYILFAIKCWFVTKTSV